MNALVEHIHPHHTIKYCIVVSSCSFRIRTICINITNFLNIFAFAVSFSYYFLCYQAPLNDAKLLLRLELRLLGSLPQASSHSTKEVLWRRQTFFAAYIWKGIDNGFKTSGFLLLLHKELPNLVCYGNR